VEKSLRLQRQRGPDGIGPKYQENSGAWRSPEVRLPRAEAFQDMASIIILEI